MQEDKNARTHGEEQNNYCSCTNTATLREREAQGEEKVGKELTTKEGKKPGTEQRKKQL